MVGFKSFAQKTDLTFNDGITSIVGPNGCGKTNIVDAIRWVLGEQKTSMLRADSMEQVIFNGSKTRKPLGMSEVSITIENNKRILPTEYTQVVITRRLFRSGESQYLLNKTQCRLRDIVDLFMDTGMGANAYSVIELKMIETILSDKADERRHLFEEAAGVTKYKSRRKEAQRKLESAQRDIARVQDIVREVQKTVNSLGRQAEKARQHQELSAKLRELDSMLFAIEYAEEFLRIKAFEAVVAETRIRRELAEKGLATLDQNVLEVEQRHLASESKLREAVLNEGQVKDALAELNQQKSIVEERIISADRSIARLSQEQTDSVNQRSSTEAELRNVQERINVLSSETSQALSDLEEKKRVVADAQEAVSMARGAVQTHREAMNATKQKLSEFRVTSDRLRINIESVGRRINENSMQMDSLGSRIAEITSQIENEQHYLPELEENLAKAESDLHTAEATQNSLRAEQEALQSEADTFRSSLAHASASIDFLTGLVDTTESSRFLLTTNEWNPKGEKLTLAEVINAAENHRVAIEAALGDAARYFVVANKSEAQQAIRALSSNNIGKATFLCRDTIPNSPEPPAIAQTDGVVGWASELVSCDQQLVGAVRSILGNTIVVHTVEDAWAAIANFKAYAAVTLQGEMVYRAGAVRGGSATKTEGVRVGRKERVEQLKVERDELQQKLNQADARLQSIKHELSEIDLRALGEVVRRATVARNERQQRIEAFKGRAEDVASQLGTLQNETVGFQTEVAQNTERLYEVEFEVEGVQKLERELEDEGMELQRSLLQAEEVYNRLIAELRTTEIHAVRIQGELQSLEADSSRLANQSLTIEQRNDQRGAEFQELTNQVASLREQLSVLNAQNETQGAELLLVRSNREEIEKSVIAESAALQSAGEDVRKHRKLTEAIVQELHNADLKFNEVRLKIETMAQRATEELGIEVPTDPTLPETEIPVETLRTDIQESRRRLTMMGNVNFLALEEFQRESERFEFLSTQLADLVTSERTLNETILEINNTAREKFTSTFNSIRENFISLFKLLFSEDDEADMVMVETADNDPLECTIDIIAKPRGKRPHSIELLSGGEKTLTAIALLFAIYMVKPSPFCILDEVDAPLDDANIDRYLKIIRKFSENTQFLMITHNKRTMEAADTLYGVTMEEPAVSKVVSVQLGSDNPTKAA